MANLLSELLISEGLAPVSASSSIDSNTSILDMSGYDGVIFIAPVTDSAATGIASLNVQGSDANSDTAMATLTGATATDTCVTNDDLNNQLLIVDVYRPLNRYIQGNVTSSVANIAYGTVIAIRYKGRKYPISDDATVLASTQVRGV